MDYGTEVKEIAPQPVAARRSRMPRSEVTEFFAVALEDVARYLEELGAEVSGPPFGRWFAFTESETEVEAGYPVLEPIEGDSDIATGELPGGRVVATVHEGPYEGLDRAHEAARAFCEESGYQIAGPPWEVYWTGPRDHPDPEGWRTEVVYPIK